MRQGDIHVEIRDGMLDLTGTVFNLYRVADVFDAYFIDGNGTRVLAVLNIR